MNKNLALAFERIATLVFHTSVILFGLCVLLWLFGPDSASFDWLGLPLVCLGLIVASTLVGCLCRDVLDQQLVEHRGRVADWSSSAEKTYSITFEDGYVAVLDYPLRIEPGLHLTIWRNGRGNITCLKVKQVRS
ncbi:MAG: hypothetical protein WCT10_05915 [Patescibacteria group bacterium]